MKKQNKKSAREKRVLTASIAVASVILAGSTFAWFTSQDEVTNRLSASANYGTEWAEDFTPPESWVPGQEINKDAGIVNTGNIDAFVRAWLEGEFTIVKQKDTSSKKFTSNYEAFTTTDLKDVSDSNLSDAGLKKVSADGKTYYKLLGTVERANDAINDTDTANDDNTYDEIKAVQAGGWLAYASTGAAFSFTPEQAYEYVNVSSQNAVGAAGTAIASSAIKDTWTAGAGLAIDSDTFTPTAAGLYIFRRNVNETTTTGKYEYEYSGYFFDGTNYYALKNTTTSTKHSDYTIDTSKLTITYDEVAGDGGVTPVKSVVPNGVELYEAERTTVKNTGITWTYTAPDTTSGTAGKMTATYGNGDTAISIDVGLSNIYGASAIDSTDAISTDKGESWTALGTAGSTTFYYNNDVESGDTTKKLIDNVTLSKNTKKEAYIAFDFDLNLKLESVQVTVDNTGNETVVAAQEVFKAGNAPTKINGTMGVKDGGTAPEVDELTWSTTDLTSG